MNSSVTGCAEIVRTDAQQHDEQLSGQLSSMGVDGEPSDSSRLVSLDANESWRSQQSSTGAQPPSIRAKGPGTSISVASSNTAAAGNRDWSLPAKLIEPQTG